MSTDEADEAPSSPVPPPKPAATSPSTEAAPRPSAPADRSALTAYLVIWVAVLGAVAYLMAR